MKYLQVERDKIKENIAVIREKAGAGELIAVLKTNAYGLGLKEIYPLLRELEVKRLAVTEPDDGIALREMGAEDEEILLLRSTACEEDVGKILSAGLTATIGSYDAAVMLNGVAEKGGVVCDVHIKIDTGMGRYGFEPSELERVLSVFRFMPNLKVTGMYTHFPSAFSNKGKTMEQHARFLRVVEAVRSAGFEPGLLHECNSAALFYAEVPVLDAVRIGSAIGGRLVAKGLFGLKKTGSLCADIAEVRWLPKNHGIGYGSAFITKKPTKIAVIPVGTSDGFMMEKARDSFRLRDCIRYALSDLYRFVRPRTAYIAINGRRARVLGHVGTTHTVCDVTDIDCTAGNQAVFEISPLYVPREIPRIYK